MDTSKEYIEMCRKAEEIQALRSCEKIVNWQDGDFFTHIGDEYPRCTHCVECNTIIKTDIWLPRQDQLQDMVDWNNYHDCNNIIGQDDLFWWFCHPKSNTGDYKWEQNMLTYVHSFSSREQLWLAFIMHEKYQKKWNGSVWGV